MRIIGLDVGGANLKIAFIDVEEGRVSRWGAHSQYFPLWREGREGLLPALQRLVEPVVRGGVDHVVATMTAELSDVYRSKREGVNHILDCIEGALPSVEVQVIDVYGGLVSSHRARREPLAVAAANWAATAWMVAQIRSDCILMDVGSTTTDIIPILKGRVVAEGRNDLERLASGELVYTGALRTPLSTLSRTAPVRGRSTRLSSELFALSGDIHLLLGNIAPEDYVTETADGRGRSRREALERLARVVCADLELLEEEVVLEMASHFYEKQLDLIREGLMQVWRRVKPPGGLDTPIVVTGLGGGFLGGEAARRAGFQRIIDLKDSLGGEASRVSTAIAAALRRAWEEGVDVSGWLRR